ncbi:MAG: Asp23/Gls24 family envelope stress response protein [Lachnospiraceae bacterium]|nr:Asp23/Gls24 family envelope stress response protein [Lachnospiraceae bacterium]
MEKDTRKTVFVLQDNENCGTVQIADDVVAMVAGIAATEIDGVSAMAGNITNELMSKVGVKKLTKGVRVEVFGKRVVVDLALTMKYGYNIPATCQKVQAKVKNAIENMTGLTVEYVNVRIVAIQMQNR